jgi:hypothetical protein
LSSHLLDTTPVNVSDRRGVGSGDCERADGFALGNEYEIAGP